MKAKKIVEKPIKNTGSRAEKTLIKKLGNSLLTKTLEDKKDFINKIILLGIGQILTDLSANCFDGFSSSSFLGLKLYKIHDQTFHQHEVES